jgi:probable O-glycosylation ligase (exosortase A-associated)
MRDIFLFAIIFASVPVCFLRPWIGILVFSWISYMNPHRFTWGPAYDFPFAKIVAVVTIAGLLFTKDKMSLPKTRETLLIVLLGIYFTFTNFFAFYPDQAWIQWEKVIKVLVMTLVTIVLINDRAKLKYLVIVIAFSIGLLGIKGGIFSLATGGEHRVYGPAGSLIADNNEMALALNMILPMLFFLAADEKHRRFKMILWFTFGMSVISTIFSYSRGGFITLAVVGAILLYKTRYKVLVIPVISLVLLISIPYVPAQWFDRIESIKTYEESQSAMGRIYAWYTAFNVAKDRPLYGSGFEGLQGNTRYRYSPKPFSTALDVHSIYFEVLGEHGFLAFGFYMAILVSTLVMTQKMKKISFSHPEYQWVNSYSNMLQISVIAYMVGGIFLGRAYFDLFYHLVAMTVIVRVLVERQWKNNQAGATAAPSGMLKRQ